MKRRLVTVLALAAFLSVAFAGIGKASAYFTASTEAQGQKTIVLGDSSTITETYDSGTKHVVITNDASSANPVYVRAAVFSGIPASISGSGWEGPASEDGIDWYYFTPDTPIEPGESTNALDVALTIPEAEENGEFNVIIVYETTPAFPAESGGYTAADWTLTAES